MCPSSPVRTPELQLAAEQLSTGECWISPKQDTPHPRAKKKSQQDSWVQFSSVAQLCLTVRYPMDGSMPGLPVHHQLLEFTQTHVHWVDDAIQLSHPLSSPSLPALNLSQHQSLIQWVTSSLRWPKYWSFSFSISPSNEYSGLISFRMDWLDLLVVQGTLKSLLQHHSPKCVQTTVLQH